jgi:hypothetical protein
LRISVLFLQTFDELGLPKRMLKSHMLPITHISKLCAILANSENGVASTPQPAAADPKMPAPAGEGAAQSAPKGKGRADAVGEAATFSLEELESERVVTPQIAIGPGGEGSLANAVATWYRLALQDCPDLPSDAIGRLVRRRQDLDKKMRVAILTLAENTAGAVQAEKGDLLKGPEPGVFTQVYKEMGAKPLPAAAAEGIATNLLRLVTTSRTNSKTDALEARRRSAKPHHKRQDSRQIGKSAGQGELEQGALALDIMWRLDR